MTVNGPWRICFVFRKGAAYDVESVDYHPDRAMPRIAHRGRLLRRELAARGLSANRLALDLGVPSHCITDMLEHSALDHRDLSLAGGPIAGAAGPAH